jgi:hypothetical protein
MDVINLIMTLMPLALLAILTTGLIKPRLVLPWCKKPNRWKVAGLFIILICAVAMFARQFNLSSEEFNTHYSITGANTVKLVKGECDVNVVVGKTVRYKGKKYTVTSIGNKAFADCDSLKSVVITNNVKMIDDYAFANCKNLSSIILPDSMECIGTDVFAGNISLNSINVPAGITQISSNLFRGCENLVSVSLPNSITGIDYNAFENCKNIKSITIPNSVKYIKTGAFSNCKHLTDVTISNSVNKISAETFIGCTSLSSVILPDSLTHIENKAFADCCNITSVNIPNSVVYIADNAFDGCNNFSSDFKAYLNKRQNEVKAMQIEVFIKHPKKVYGMDGYNASGRGRQWEWTTSFTAKKNKKPIELTTSTYTITNKEGKTWEPGASVNPHETIIIETNGMSNSVTETFIDYYDDNYNLDWVGAVFSRTWRGKDEHEVLIIIEEIVHFD